MTQNINTSLSVNLTTVEAITLGSSTNNFPVPSLYSHSWAPGTLADSANLHWESGAVTLAGGASVTYTLSALIDTVGRSIALVGVRFLMLAVTVRSAGDKLTLGGAALNPWAAPFGAAAQTLTVWDLLLLTASNTDRFAVTAGASDQLKITNSGTSPITFNLTLGGVNA